MVYGDHWSEPARCGRCGQERSTHDDGYCKGVVESMRKPAAARKRETALDAFKREGEPNGGTDQGA